MASVIHRLARGLARLIKLSPAPVVPPEPPLVITEGTPLRSYFRPQGGKLPDQIILHESVTRTRAKTIEVLKTKKPSPLGVHYIIDQDGSVTRHVPTGKATVHARGHNDRSVAVEIVSAYYPAEGDEAITAVWAHRGKWAVLPQPVIQLEAVWRVVLQVCQDHPTIPLRFPCVGSDRFRWGSANPATSADQPGIMAHHRFDHADALIAEHYCYARSRGLDPSSAWASTIEAASSGSRLTPLPSQPEKVA